MREWVLRVNGASVSSDSTSDEAHFPLAPMSPRRAIGVKLRKAKKSGQTNDVFDFELDQHWLLLMIMCAIIFLFTSLSLPLSSCHFTFPCGTAAIGKWQKSVFVHFLRANFESVPVNGVVAQLANWPPNRVPVKVERRLF